MVSTEFISSICRADIDGYDHLADRSMNKKLLQELLGCSNIVSRLDDGTIWHQRAAVGHVFYFVSLKTPDAICLYMPYREIVLSPELAALEVCSWQCTTLCGFDQGWQAARDAVFGMLLSRSRFIVSSDCLTRFGGRFWEDRVGQHILAGGEGGSVRNGVLTYEEHWSWFAPEHLGRDGSSRFFLESAHLETRTQTVREGA